MAEDYEIVKRLLHYVLVCVGDVYGSAGVELPDRRYVQIGQSTLDCEQVTTSLVQLYLGGPGDQAIQPQPCEGLKTAVIAVEVVRCVPSFDIKGKPPTPKQIEEAADKFLVDAYLLMDILPKVVDVSTWGVLSDVSVGERSGGYQGITMNLIMAIQDVPLDM